MPDTVRHSPTETDIPGQTYSLSVRQAQALFDAAEPSDGAKAFDIGYDIQSMTRYTYDGHSTRYNLFARLFDGGLWPDLYSKLSM